VSDSSFAVDTLTHTATTVLAHARTVAPSAALEQDVTRLVAAGMHCRVAFNRPPADGEVAIVLVDPTTEWAALARHDAAARYVRDNCYTSAASRTIICDAAVLTTRADALLGVPATVDQRRAFERWILGHELGHIATATTGFHTDQRTDIRRARDLAQQRREYAADCWMVRTLERAAPRADQVAFESFAIDVINAHFRRTEPDRPSGVGSSSTTTPLIRMISGAAARIRTPCFGRSSSSTLLLQRHVVTLQHSSLLSCGSSFPIPSGRAAGPAGCPER
jgi:hypothetical protein